MGERVAPFGGVPPHAERKPIGLPRKAALVQPKKDDKPVEGHITMAPGATLQPQRSRVGTPSQLDATTTAGSAAAPAPPAGATAQNGTAPVAEQHGAGVGAALEAPTWDDAAAAAPPLPAHVASLGSSSKSGSFFSRKEQYAALAHEKCAEALRVAQEQSNKTRAEKRPKGVWWGFHHFWPRDVLEGNFEKPPLEDPVVRAAPRASPCAL